MLLVLFIFVLNFEYQSTKTCEGLHFGGFAARKKIWISLFDVGERKTPSYYPRAGVSGSSGGYRSLWVDTEEVRGVSWVLSLFPG